ncbi:MAG TPA: HYR domain-containing protein [Saprospiraceae bacterium]|nr:HYR domain-containing protein [Saprospiraceae bacterium]
MRKCIFLLALLYASFLSAQTTLDIGIFNNPPNSNRLEIKIRPNQNVVNGVYSAGVFTIRFPASYGVALVAPSNLNSTLFNYNLANQGTDGTYQYYSFSFVSPYTVNWTAGVAYTIAIVEIVSGSSGGMGTFEIGNNAWTAANNGDIYQELNGVAASGTIYQPFATAPLIPAGPDNVPPSIACTANKTVGTNGNACTYNNIGTGWNAAGNDNFPGFTITYYFSGAGSGTVFSLDGVAFNKGLTTVTAIIKDAANLADTCMFTVTVNDIQPPLITAPPALNVFANTASCQANVVMGTPQTSDNCAVAQVSNNAPAHFPTGNTVVIWTATDAAGLTATATQLVNVQSGLAATAPNLSSTLICNGVSSVLSFPISGGVSPYTVTYNANGNSTTLNAYASNQPVTVTPSLTTSYVLVNVTDAIGCSITPAGLTRTLIVKPTPTLDALTPSAAVVCAGQPVSITASGLLPGVPVIFHYTLNGTPGSQTAPSTNDGTAVLLNNTYAAGNYALTANSVTVAGCIANISASTSFVVDAVSAACQLSVAGAIATEAGYTVKNVAVDLNNAVGTVPLFDFSGTSDTLGQYKFTDMVPVAANGDIVPYKNDNHLNGVTTFDLVLISKHILGLSPLDSPYKIIAADANHSGLVTTGDIVDLRKMILGIYDELPTNTSWRFVDADFTFPFADNPFFSPFPERISLVNLQSDLLDADFVAIKTGDVNGTVIAGILPAAAEERSGETLVFNVNGADFSKPIAAGQERTLYFEADRHTAGYQFTLDLNGLEVLEIIPGPGMGAEHFAVFEGAVTTSFVEAETGGPMPGFGIRFRVKSGGMLREKIRISSRITPAEAYPEMPENMVRVMEVQLHFGQNDLSGPSFELYPNAPNPFTDATTVSFYLPEPETVLITIRDQTARILFSRQQECMKGNNKIVISGEGLPAGILTCKIETSDNFAVQKILKI